MGSATLVNALDTYVDERYPTKNFSTLTAMYINGWTTRNEEVFLYFSTPFPKGVTITSATLKVYQASSHNSSTWSLVAGFADKAWSKSSIVWNGRPALKSTPRTTITGTPALKREWAFDVKAQMQAVSNGTPWYGFKIQMNTQVSTGLVPALIASESSLTSLRPKLEVTWSDAPLAPVNLLPNGGYIVSNTVPILQMDFVDLSGDKTLDSVRVQMNATNAWTSPTFDSGEVDVDSPQLDLSTTSFTPMTNNQTIWWRACTQDGAGLWSPWSTPTYFQYITRGTLTMTAPTGTVLSDPTPNITWTFTGATQRAFQVYVTERIPQADGTFLDGKAFTSGKITSTAGVYPVPAGWITNEAYDYRISLYVWDTLNRQTIANGPTWQNVQKVVDYVYDATVPAVDSISSVLDSQNVQVALTWVRSQQPDSWTVYRNGVVLVTLPGYAPQVGATTTYTWTDPKPLPRTVNQYKVVPTVNGKGAASSPVTNVTYTPVTLILGDANGGNVVPLFNSESDIDIDSNTSVFQPVGSTNPVLISQGNRGYRGKISGRISNETLPSIANSALLARWKANTQLGRVVTIWWIDQLLTGLVANPTYRPVARNEGVVYDVSFDFYQVQ